MCAGASARAVSRRLRAALGCILAAAVAMAAQARAQSTLYVDADAPPGGNGSSWATAHRYLQDALAAAAASGGTVEEVWVAGGTYRPDESAANPSGTGDRTATFQMLNGVALYGHFGGTETDPSQRDLNNPAHETILSGDLSGDDGPDFANTAENSIHVVNASGTDATAILDGFTITAGNANLPDVWVSSGGGMLINAGSPTIRDCTFTLNQNAGNGNSDSGGGAVRIHQGSPRFTDCAFVANRSLGNLWGGGAAFIKGPSSSPLFSGCTFQSNEFVGPADANGGGGGAIRSGGFASPRFVNCDFIANEAPAGGFAAGGALLLEGGDHRITNCKFFGNSATNGGGVVVNSATGSLTNCVFSGNTAGTAAGLWLGSSSLIVTNCTFTHNAASSVGGGLYTSAATPTASNCIFWQNTSNNGANTGESAQIYVQSGSIIVNHSLIDGLDSFAGNGNIAGDPIFLRIPSPGPDGNWDGVNDDYGDLRLAYGSPAADAGDNAAVPPDSADLDEDGNTSEPTPLDLAGRARFGEDPCAANTGAGTPPIVDMGAYERNATAPPAQSVLYVKADASGADSGASWADAFTDLQTALCAAAASGGVVQEIWVARGTYTPTRGTDRAVSFQLLNGVTLYGGFAGNEALLLERDPAANETILSGDLLGNDDPNDFPTGAGDPPGPSYTDNSYHVVVGGGTDETAVLDGFTISGGNANGPAPDDNGGGLLNEPGSPTMRDCTFSRNYAFGGGGGVYNHGGGRHVFSRCTFSENVARDDGGAVHNFGGTPKTFDDCSFTRNYAGGGGGIFNNNVQANLTRCAFTRNRGNIGGAVYNFNDLSSPTVTSCIFNGNRAIATIGGRGGAIAHNSGASSNCTNCVFSGNSAVDSDPSDGNVGRGGAIYRGAGTLSNCTFSGNVASNAGGVQDNDAAGPTFTNCILWGNQAAVGGTSQIRGASTVTYSIIQGGWVGTGNVNADPLFVRNPEDGLDNQWGTEDDDYGDLRLGPGSPGIDAGSNDAVAADDADLDCDGNRLEATPLDLNGSPRFVDDALAPDCPHAPGTCGDAPIVDMGPYEAGPLIGMRVFVNAAATGTNNGSSWADAFTNPRDALAYAVATGCGALEIWVAQGTYTPDGGYRAPGGPHTPGSGDPNDTFQLVDGVVLYGGFAGGESDLSQRDPIVNPTILSGDLAGNDAGPPNDPSHAENGRHVVTGTGNSGTAILDGFTISGGVGGDPPTGGGFLTLAAGPTLRNCAITGNDAFCGGGLACIGGLISVDDVRLHGNTSLAGNGGSLSGSRATILGAWTIENERLDVFGSEINGPGVLELGEGALLRVDNVSVCDAELIDEAAGDAGVATFFAPQLPGPPPLPARWSIVNAPVGDLALVGADTTWVIAPSSLSPPALLSWTNSYLNQDLSVGGRAEATFSPGGTLMISGDLYDGSDPSAKLLFSGLLLRATVGPFRVRETTATSNALEFVERPPLSPTLGFILTNPRLVLARTQLLTLTLDQVLQDGGPLNNFSPLAALTLAGGSRLTLEPQFPLPSATIVRTDVAGTGDITIDLGARLIVAGPGTVVDLSGQAPGGGCAETAPQSWGTITVNGELLVQDATVQNSNVSVTLGGIDGSSNIVNNDLTLLESSADYGGQFFVEGGATIQCNVITSYGDRYLDLDPDPDAVPRPTVTDNQIVVIITQGTQSAQGELLELRSRDYDNGLGGGASGAYALGGSAGYNDTWALERLTVEPGAKVTLTNRQGFCFQAGGCVTPEALYVKELVLGADAVLNVGLQRLYYQTLNADPTAAIVNVPLLGFSLKVIAMEDDTEFGVRVQTRVRDAGDVQPPPPAAPLEGRVARIADPLDGGNGVMELDTQAPDKQSATSVAAKGAFARAGEDEIVVAFRYRFVQDTTNPANPAEIVVYLSDDPAVSAGLVEVARLLPPLAGRPGSVGSSQFAPFWGEFARGGLNFHRGTYVEIELRGTDAVVHIDDWDPQIECLACADLNGTTTVDRSDFLVVLSEYGGAVDPVPGGSSDPNEINRACLDNGLNGDKYVDLSDVLAWDTLLNGNLLNACLSGLETTGVAPAGRGVTLGSGGGLLIAGKPNGPIPGRPHDGLYEDRLYQTDLSGACAAPSALPASAPDPNEGYRSNGRLVVDGDGVTYQVHSTQGLVRLDTAEIAIAPQIRTAPSGETVYVGVTLGEPGGGYVDFTGVPLLDAAFDPADATIVYVVPVVVDPPGTDADHAPYKAAAKLQRLGGGDCNLLALFGQNPADVSTVRTEGGEIVYEPDFQRLRELELDTQGNLYVLSAQSVGANNWLLIYAAADLDPDAELCVSLNAAADSSCGAWAGIDLEGPFGLVASQFASDRLYLASSRLETDATTTRLRRFSLTRDGGGQVTAVNYLSAQDVIIDHSLTTDPDPGNVFSSTFIAATTAMAENRADGTLYVAGFTMPRVPRNLSIEDGRYQQLFGSEAPVFTKPTLTIVPSGTSGTVFAQDLDCGYNCATDCTLALPLSAAVLSPAAPPCPADIDGNGVVELGDLAILLSAFGSCTGQPAYRPEADLDASGCVELADLAILLSAFGTSCP